MKKLFLLAVLSSLALGVFAQKTVKIEDTQARLLDVMSNAYVHPLTVELKVMSETRIRVAYPLTVEDLESMDRKLENIRSWAVYKASKDYDCDVIVAATFNFRTKGTGYEIEIVGFPANFINWKTATQADLEWIKMEKVQTTSERDKIQAVVKK